MTTPSRLPEELAVVIPCYNAGHRVRAVVERTLPVAARVIVVDDGSTDGAITALRDLPLEILTLPQNHGKGYALLEGYRKALEDTSVRGVAALDADGQHNPEELPQLYEHFLAEGADLVIGSRQFDSGSVPFRSRLGNTVTVSVVALLFGARLPDTQSGYRIASRRFLEAVLPLIRGGRYETEMELVARALRGNYKVVPVPIETIYETGNASSHFRKFRDSWRIYRTLFGLARRLR